MKLISILWIFACLLFSQILFAEDGNVEFQITKKYGIEAAYLSAYLYGFTKFVTWDFEDAKTVNVCLARDEPFGKVIDLIEKNLGPEFLSVKLFRFNDVETMENRHHCLVLYGSYSI